MMPEQLGPHSSEGGHPPLFSLQDDVKKAEYIGFEVQQHVPRQTPIGKQNTLKKWKRQLTLLYMHGPGEYYAN